MKKRDLTILLADYYYHASSELRTIAADLTRSVVCLSVSLLLITAI